ncbi:MAG: PEGA domain protein [Syntrophorhabdus sp. PtaU1.Bin153]|nr:MAG: PEGA domain protein [Syntrophorhabdus sp. PtaU1.Bin153]
MKECVKCGIHYEDYFTFCRKCGGPLATPADAGSETEVKTHSGRDIPSDATQFASARANVKECPSCGTPNSPDANFCKRCRESLNGGDADGEVLEDSHENDGVTRVEEATAGEPLLEETGIIQEDSLASTSSDIGPLPSKSHALRNVILAVSVIACLVVGYFLVMPKGKAEISILTRPTGAFVTIDGRDSGKTPRTSMLLNSGTHHIVLEMKGYSTTEQDIDIKSGEKKNLLITLQRKSASTEKSRDRNAISNSDKERPSASTAGPTNYEGEIVGFVERYFKDTEDKNIDLVLAHYGEQVDYFAKGIVRKDFIRKDKQLYFKRWTTIVNTLDGQPQIQETSQVNTKVVRFASEFSVKNEKQCITGRADNTWTLQSENNQWKIIGEQQQVLSRDKK